MDRLISDDAKDEDIQTPESRWEERTRDAEGVLYGYGASASRVALPRRRGVFGLWYGHM